MNCESEPEPEPESESESESESEKRITEMELRSSRMPWPDVLAGTVLMPTGQASLDLIDATHLDLAGIWALHSRIHGLLGAYPLLAAVVVASSVLTLAFTCLSGGIRSRPTGAIQPRQNYRRWRS